MISEYVKHLENRDIYPETNRPWSINDISLSWRSKVVEIIVRDGYYVDSTDGTVYPKEE